MAGSLNKVQIIGNLGADPEIRTFPNGGKVANLRVATSEQWRDKATGERRERTEWHSVAIFNEHLIRVVENWARKGSKLYIEGRLETRKWKDSSGNDRYTTEITVRPYRGEITLLDRPGRGDQPEQSHGGSRSSTARPPQASPAPSRPGDREPDWQGPEYPGYFIYDDELPF